MQPGGTTGLRAGHRRSEAPAETRVETAWPSPLRIRHRGRRHLLLLEDREAALLLDILEAALPAEAISGLRTSNPDLSGFFNRIYSELIDAARQVWQQGPVSASGPSHPA